MNDIDENQNKYTNKSCEIDKSIIITNKNAINNNSNNTNNNNTNSSIMKNDNNNDNIMINEKKNHICSNCNNSMNNNNNSNNIVNSKEYTNTMLDYKQAQLTKTASHSNDAVGENEYEVQCIEDNLVELNSKTSFTFREGLRRQTSLDFNTSRPRVLSQTSLRKENKDEVFENIASSRPSLSRKYTLESIPHDRVIAHNHVRPISSAPTLSSVTRKTRHFSVVSERERPKSYDVNRMNRKRHSLIPAHSRHSIKRNSLIPEASNKNCSRFHNKRGSVILATPNTLVQNTNIFTGRHNSIVVHRKVSRQTSRERAHSSDAQWVSCNGKHLVRRTTFSYMTKVS